MVLGKLGFRIKKNEFRPLLTSCAEINLKWIKDLNIRPEIIKLLGENMGKIFTVLSLAMISGYDTNVQVTKEKKTDDLNFMKMKNKFFKRQ